MKATPDKSSRSCMVKKSDAEFKRGRERRLHEGRCCPLFQTDVQFLITQNRKTAKMINFKLPA